MGASPAAPSMGGIVLWGFAPALSSAAPFIWGRTHKYSLAFVSRARPRAGQSPKSTGRGGEDAQPPLPGGVQFLESVGWHRDRAGTAGRAGGALRNFSAELCEHFSANVGGKLRNQGSAPSPLERGCERLKSPSALAFPASHR